MKKYHRIATVQLFIRPPTLTIGSENTPSQCRNTQLLAPITGAALPWFRSPLLTESHVASFYLRLINMLKFSASLRRGASENKIYDVKHTSLVTCISHEVHRRHQCSSSHLDCRNKEPTIPTGTTQTPESYFNIYSRTNHTHPLSQDHIR